MPTWDMQFWPMLFAQLTQQSEITKLEEQGIYEFQILNKVI